MKAAVFSILFLIFFSCSHEKNIKKRIDANPSLIYDSIESRMPGNLLITNDYLLWTDPLSADNYLHIIDLKTNREICSMIDIGEGPNEYIQPNIAYADDNKIIIHDIKKAVYLSLDSVAIGNKTTEILNINDIQEVDRCIEIDYNKILTLNTHKEKPFQINNYEFGEYPFKDVHNNYDVSQGNIAYKKDSGYLVYATMSYPYIALYKNNNNEFELLWDKRGEMDYEIIKNNVILDKKRGGISEIALTKDYIVTLERDREVDKTDVSTVGRDFNKLAQTLFVYNYNSELIKIVNFNLPILRIAGNPKKNIIYAIIVDDDFKIVKYNLQKLIS